MKQTQKTPHNYFARFAKIISDAVGTVWSFLLALLAIVIWTITGPLFHFSDTWQLIINTGTTIITFLMVFLIQHTQNRDTVILNLKLDELIKSHRAANNQSIDLNKLTDEELIALEKEYKKICRKKTGA
ncbi:low affinity iron permease family protein [Legionella clemsonensis]|uniref:Low affinity iron permease n=1 Tax=Legionella clemsonensis TaxID=1867846 RepID=A0A222P0F4_9GAMM|nr:low affinity iron permease family protein [Legionella clemsonensis]ASQ45334.1 Low affinity iron permease [Legionella clemsonensis]